MAVTYLVGNNTTAQENLIPALKDISYCRVIGISEGERDPIDRTDSHDGSWDLAVAEPFLNDGSGLGVILVGILDELPHG